MAIRRTSVGQSRHGRVHLRRAARPRIRLSALAAVARHVDPDARRGAGVRRRGHPLLRSR